MPTSLDRVALPNLKVYFFVSIVAFLTCICLALVVVKDSSWKLTPNTTRHSIRQLILDVFSELIKESVCVWIIINMTFCIIIVLGRAVQELVFGELRVSEQQSLRDKFWNFLFYKFIFIFGVLNVQNINEVLLWFSWFGILGFLHLLSHLSKERFKYLIFSPRTPTWNHVKLLTLLISILALSNIMLLTSVFIGFYVGLNTLLFMSSEVVLLLIRTLHVIIKYTIHLYDLKNEEDSMDSDETEKQEWEKRGPVSYYIDYIFDMMALIIELLNHGHMLLGGNIFLSMASLVICMQIRYLLQEIQRRINRHQNYLWIRSHLEENYAMATEKELEDNSDNCAICWEKMKSARKLPCMHMFHDVCLVSWLEQDSSCPTCRFSLNIQNLLLPNPPHTGLNNIQESIQRPLNHFFHFDGSRYVSWLPSFSVEVSPAGARYNQEANNSQLDAMARKVQQLFPNMPLSTVIEDLRTTRSVELTVENILDGRFPSTAITFRDIEAIPQPMTTTSAVKSWEELNDDCMVTEDYMALGSRFSKSSLEREKILQTRKENLLKIARKRYIEKQKAAAAINN